ncbi:nucleotidyltransferase family protein [Rhodothalassium salexigens]|uniref:nucleotidyltransferase family protein n=1 Tax=Rhodothalassium salexigens TaxID=1086 RepID=UPI001912762F|nr:nucleotidyltransferase family protein [Rhodothalassium salexigens]
MVSAPSPTPTAAPSTAPGAAPGASGSRSKETVATTRPRELRPSLRVKVPPRAMVLAAGLGRRMLPLTETTPKPLVEVAGRPLIDRTLDRLGEAGVKQAVVNVHHHAGKLEKHLAGRKGRPELIVSDERKHLLDSGGGVAHALDHFKGKPFWVVNGDIVWLDGLNNTFKLVANYWDKGRMDALLLIVAAVSAHGYRGQGDFDMDADGRLKRKAERTITPFVYGGIAILSPKLFKGIDEEVFSLNRVFDRAEAQGRLYGVMHEGRWAHVGTPDAIAEAERRLFA